MTPPFQQLTTLEKRTSERSISLGHSLPPPHLVPVTQESVLTLHRILSHVITFSQLSCVFHRAADTFAGVPASTGFPGSLYTQEA